MSANEIPVRVMLVGIGGYGSLYVNAMLDHGAAHGALLVAAVDPAFRQCQRLNELTARGVPVLASLDEALNTVPADLVVLSTPIALHASQTCAALAKGAHVLCEKPLCGSLDDARAMLAARERAGRQVAIGYQWSFSDAILSLKRDILAGRLGAPRRLKTLVLWPRALSYYARNRWAGRIRDDRGGWVLDSPLNNATAHYLHNMLFLLGDRLDRSLRPAIVAAELYRANAIENYDTAVVRAVAPGGAEVFMATAHPVEQTVGPACRFEFEQAVVTYDGMKDDRFVARFTNGEVKEYVMPESHDGKLWATLACLRSGEPVPCGIETALSHTVCMLAAQQASVITPFPDRLIRREGRPENDTLVCVEGLAGTLQACFDQAALPSETGVPWARHGQTIELAPLFTEAG
jgi:predicted dehydrogenase